MNALNPVTGMTPVDHSDHSDHSDRSDRSTIADYSSLDERWAAVLRKDPDADGEFVFAVRTTGVFCRPSCPSRPARLENVVFFDTTTQAATAGFRACLRCKPEDVSLEHRRGDLIRRMCETMQASPVRLSLNQLAVQAGLSAYHFHRVFKSITGVTPGDFQSAIRKARVVTSLAKSGSVTDAIYDAGFNSSGRFYEGADRMLGMKPSSYRKGGAGEAIRYAVEPCALGVILVAATQRGVCAIEFGDSAHDLVARLRERFPKAEFSPADAQFKQWLGKILGYLEQPRGALDLPLDVQGTLFQQRVWKSLRDIAPGSQASYAEVAQSIGQPGAARAVASACASNPVALAVPCHRVVRSNGELSGYRWGGARKAELLRRESEG